MYTPPSFVETDRKTLHDFMDQNSFATLISADKQEPFASHLPLLIERDRGPQGVLTGHFARANPHWQLANGQRVLIVFHGPHAYISPGWVQSNTMVPTWNYVAVHAYGVLRNVDDPHLVKNILTRMVSRYESRREQPWSMDLADKEFIDKLVATIAGFEIEIDHLEGKWKLSQNHPTERREQIISGLLGAAHEDDAVVAKLMKAAL